MRVVEMSTHLAGGLRTDERIEGRIGDSSDEEEVGVVGDDDDDGDRFEESEGEGDGGAGESSGDDADSGDDDDSDGGDSQSAAVRGGHGGGRGRGVPLKEITFQRLGGEVGKVTMHAPIMPYTVPPGRILQITKETLYSQNQSMEEFIRFLLRGGTPQIRAVDSHGPPERLEPDFKRLVKGSYPSKRKTTLAAPKAKRQRTETVVERDETRDESETGDRGGAEIVSESVETGTTDAQADPGSESSEDTEET